MSRTAAIFAICFAVSRALAQAPDAAMPPDLAAYREAAKETDPEKKVAALERWLADHPESNMRDTASAAILETLATRLPAQQDRIRKFARAMYLAAPEKEKGKTAYQIASELLDANILLKDAEGYARKGADAKALWWYLAGESEAAARRNQPQKIDQLRKRFETTRAARLAVLGRIEVRLGHMQKARKLLDEANSVDGTNGDVQAELGVMAAKAGDDRKALDFLISAKLSGHATKEANEAFDAVYKKQHNGSLEGADAMLDAEYNRRFPNPLKVEPYKPTEKRSDRVVLAEVFTGAGCGPCAAADLAFDAAMERYSRKEVAVIMYHEHVPRPDPMTTAETQAIYKAYDGVGVPTYLIDGVKSLGGAPRNMVKFVYDRFNPVVEEELEKPAEAHISAGASRNGNAVSVNARVFGVKSDSKDLKVEIALLEKQLRYNGENGIRFHPMVVRSIRSFDLAGENYRQSFDLDQVSQAIKAHLDDYEAKGHRGEPFKFSEKKYRIDPNDLAVVIFVHDAKTRHVLQAGFIDLGGDTSRPVTMEATNAR